MGTRSNIQFVYGSEKFQVYKHWDGYMDYMIPHLAEFIKWNGFRSDDISYSVANYILYVKLESALIDKETTIEEQFKNAGANSTLHTGIGLEEPTNDFKDSWVEYFYEVDLLNKTVKAYNPDKLIGEFKFGTQEDLDIMLNYVEPEEEIVCK